jgi:hypothetical protein
MTTTIIPTYPTQRMKIIPLTQGKVVIVDDEDFEKVNNYRWRTLNGRSGYACYAISGQTPNHILMHRLIMGATVDQQIDHKNGNGLDNRKANLRPCNHIQNQCNRGIPNNNTSGFKGVSWDRDADKWRAYITVNKKRISLGKFTSVIEASKAYDKSALTHFSQFAFINKTITRSP